METSKNFIVKSLKLYSDTDYFCDDNIRYQSVFYFPLSTYVTSELIIINKFYGIKDWSLKLEFQFMDSDIWDDELPCYNQKIDRVIKQDELEVKILNVVEIGEFVEYGEFVTNFTVMYRQFNLFDNTIVASTDLRIIYCEDFTKGCNPFFEISDFKLTSANSDQPQKIFSRNSYPIDLTFSLDYKDEFRSDYPDLPDIMNFELLYILRDEEGEKIGDYLSEETIYLSDNYATIYLNLTKEIKEITKVGNYSIEILFAGFQMFKFDFRIDCNDELDDDENGPVD